jgi:hypothetical protein
MTTKRSHDPLEIDPPPFHMMPGLMKNYVNAMNQKGEGFW